MRIVSVCVGEPPQPGEIPIFGAMVSPCVTGRFAVTLGIAHVGITCLVEDKEQAAYIFSKFAEVCDATRDDLLAQLRAERTEK